MFRKFFTVIFFISLVYGHEALKEKYPFDKVVIWGYKLHSHTHSYIHWALHRAFAYLGYETLWLDQNDDISKIDFSNALFITEGNCDQNIPLIEECRYILHNCTDPKYQWLRDNNQCINLQVYTHDCLTRNLKKIEDCIYANVNDQIIYMPWATDLLPHEIDQIKEKIKNGEQNREEIAYYIGTITGSGQCENENQLKEFEKACNENGISFCNLKSVSMQENADYILNSRLAPTIQSAWQIEKGYIPCRIFKNISYGQMGVTNSYYVYELFKGKIVYNPDCYELCYDALKRQKQMTQEELFELMDFVKDHHTYINRIEYLLWLLDQVNPIKKGT